MTLDDASLAWLRQRAKRVHGGNLSAAISETTELARKQDALRRFLDEEGVPELDAAEMAELAAEWRTPLPQRPPSQKKTRRT